MLLLTILGFLMLALYGYACTSTVITMGPVEGYQDAQQWADEVEASLCPMRRAEALGLIPGAYTMPPKLARLLGLAPVEAHTHTISHTRMRAIVPSMRYW